MWMLKIKTPNAYIDWSRVTIPEARQMIRSYIKHFGVITYTLTKVRA